MWVEWKILRVYFNDCENLHCVGYPINKKNAYSLKVFTQWNGFFHLQKHKILADVSQLLNCKDKSVGTVNVMLILSISFCE